VARLTITKYPNYQVRGYQKIKYYRSEDTIKYYRSEDTIK